MSTGIESDSSIADYRLEFRGNAKEYFGIWIVNLFLSIITLGIYTAWAKVRRQRYFYGNTYVDNHNFEYHAKPKQILIGRIIVVVLLVIYQLLVTWNPIFSVLLLVYFLAFPWILNKALSFNARVSSYRNIHFNFVGDYGTAFAAFLLMPIVALMTFGLLAPLSTKMSQNYIGDGLRWGNSKFETKISAKNLYKLLGLSFLFLIVAVPAVAGLFWVIFNAINFGFLEGYTTTAGTADLLDNIGIFGAIMGGYIAFGLSYLFYSIGTRNIAYQATNLITKAEGEPKKSHRLNSDLSILRYMWILLSNLIAILLTVGLLRAWAAVRTWRYKVEHTSIKTAGSLDNLVATQVDEGRAISAEFFDIEGIDFGI